MSVLIPSSKTDVFKAILEQIEKINNQINLHFRTPEGLYIQTMDPAHACLCDISLSEEWFETYDIDSETVIGVNLEIINKILACKGKNEKIEFIIKTKEESDKLMIKMIDEKTGETTKSFETSIYDIDCELLEIPEVEADIDISVNTQIFTNAIEQIGIFGDTLIFKCTDDGITFISEDNKLYTTMTYTIKTGDLDEYSTIDEEHVDEYNMSYFTKLCGFSKVVGKTSYVSIKIKEQAPIMLNYCIGENLGKISVCLAPKFRDEDDEGD